MEPTFDAIIRLHVEQHLLCWYLKSFAFHYVINLTG